MILQPPGQNLYPGILVGLDIRRSLVTPVLTVDRAMVPFPWERYLDYLLEEPFQGERRVRQCCDAGNCFSLM